MILIITSFTITYRERIREFEMLSSLGMSKSQRRKMCLKEGTIIGTIGIIIGIIVGYIISIFVINSLADIVSNYENYMSFEINHTTFSLNFPIGAILLTAIILYIIVFFATLLPLAKINRIDIISGINGNSKRKSKKKKVPFVVKKIFKQEGELAYRYTKNQKARHTSMVSSITVSVLIFLIINGIITNFLQNANKLTYDDYKLECQIDLVDGVINYLKENNLLKGYVVRTDALYLNKSNNSSYSDYQIEVPVNKISDVMTEILTGNKQADIGTTIIDFSNGSTNYDGEKYNFTVMPYYFDDETYKAILKMAGLDKLEENECILLNTQEVENSTYGDKFELTKYVPRRRNNNFCYK